MSEKVYSIFPVGFEKGTEIADCLWASAYSYNGILKFEVNSGSVEYVKKFEIYDDWAQRLFSAAINVENKIYFAPMEAEHIAVYDMVSDYIDYIEIEKSNIKYKEKTKFYEIHRIDNFLYFIPHNYPAILKIDLSTKKLIYLDSWVKRYIDDLLEKKDVFRQNSYVLGKKIYIPCCSRNEIVVINTYDDDFSYITFKSDSVGCVGLNFYADSLFVAPAIGHTITEIDETGTHKNSFCVNEKGLCERLSYNNGISIDSKMILAPCEDNFLIVFDCKTKKYEEVNFRRIAKFVDSQYYNFQIMGEFVFKNENYIIDYARMNFYLIDLKNENLFKRVNFNIKYESFEQQLKDASKIFEKKGFNRYETQFDSLGMFLKQIYSNG